MSNIAYKTLLDFTEKALIKGFGYSQAEAAITARVLVEADARGIPSHGVARLAFYRQNLAGGFAKPGTEPEIVWSTPSSLVVDGHGGIGCYVADFAVQKMLGLAEKTGLAFCSVRNSNHYGIAAYWAELAAERDMIGFAFTNSYLSATPTFGRRRCLGTNPIAVAVPEADGRAFLLDMATTTVAHGKIELYDRRKKPMPLGWVIDEEGKGVTDATAFEETFHGSSLGGHLFLGGAGEENGGHKGFGLGLLVELLCSGLSMGSASFATYNNNKKGEAGICHFFGALRLDLFGPPEDLKKNIGEIIETIRSGEKVPGHDRIYIHGEKESESRDLAMREGVFLDEATRDFLAALADEFSLPRPEGAL